MQRSILHTLLVGALMGAAFLLGQWLPSPVAEAQGRGPVPPPRRPDPGTNEPTVGEPRTEAGLVYPEESGTGGAANGFIAVTGSYGVGTSVLYVLDTVNRQLAAYEARGGASSTRRIVFVGARRIDLDLQLEGYNDRSEYEYRDLKRLFEQRGERSAEPATGLERTGRGR